MWILICATYFPQSHMYQFMECITDKGAGQPWSNPWNIANHLFRSISRNFSSWTMLVEILPKALKRATTSFLERARSGVCLGKSWPIGLLVNASDPRSWSKSPEKRIFRAVPKPVTCLEKAWAKLKTIQRGFFWKFPTRHKWNYLQLPPKLALITANTVHHAWYVPEVPLELPFQLLCMKSRSTM